MGDFSLRFSTILLAALSLAVPAFPASSWPPVPPEELAAAAPRVEKDAHAEANLWEVWVNDEAKSGYPHSVLRHYLRIKIFDQRGVEMMSKIDIPYRGSTHISDVHARTTKPNGEVVDLTKDGIFDRVVVKGRGLKFRAISFALPALEPQAIIEYGWLESREDALANYVELDLQRSIPVHLVRYHLHPLQSPYFPFAMRYAAYQVKSQPFVPEHNGYYTASWSDLPAFSEESDMPAEHNVKAWILVFYEEGSNLDPDQYWRVQGKKLYSEVKTELKINNDVKQTAARITEGASTDEAKLAKIFDFCQKEIRNLNGAHGAVTAEDRAAFKPNKNTADTLKQGIGTGRDIDLLFTALAIASGLDARFAKNSDREVATFIPQLSNSYFMSTYDVAVLVNDKWQFFDPSAPFVPFGMLRWQEEGTYALISDPKEPLLIPTPVSPASKSLRLRTADFKVSEDGALEGTVTVEHRGHAATEKRWQYVDETSDQKVETLTRELKHQYGDVEISNVLLQDLSSGEKGFVESFHIRVPVYAQRTGKRLFVRPSFFEANMAPRYTASDRKYPVQFQYPWMEVDHVTFTLPEGFQLDHGDVPGETSFGAAGHFKAAARYAPSLRKLSYTRELVFIENSKLYLQKEAYPALKQIFQVIHTADDHALTFKQEPQTASK